MIDYREHVQMQFRKFEREYGAHVAAGVLAVASSNDSIEKVEDTELRIVFLALNTFHTQFIASQKSYPFGIR